MQSPRPTCYACFRPRALCICELLRPIDNRTRVTVVQHPREQFHPLSTVRIAEGSLRRVRVLRGNLDSLAEQLERVSFLPGAVLLYPSVDAVDLETIATQVPPPEIVVLDGTWHQASTLLRDLPQLPSLPRVRFAPSAPSEYLIRKEPRADYLSSVESIAHVLGLLEPETPGLDSLRESFRGMIQKNLRARRPEATTRSARRRGRSYAFPELLTLSERPASVVYGEGAHLEAGSSGRHPLILCAQRLGAGEKLRLLLRPPGAIRQRLLSELGLAPGEVDRDGLDLDSARRLLAEWLAQDVVVAWNASSLAMLGAIGVRPSERLFLKAVYCDWRRSLGDRPTSWGSLSQILASRGLASDGKVLEAGGRAERRLEQTRALYTYLRAQARQAQ